MENEKIVLVDIFDRQIGVGEKLEVHQKKLLHRAFSIFLYQDNKMLIQKRAEGKYHSAGLWANTCCSHPRDGEVLEIAVKRRLLEEAGIQCTVTELYTFIYMENFTDGLSEYELDHVFVGEYTGDFVPNPEECSEMKWVDMDELAKDLQENPLHYAAWFLTAAPEVIKSIRKGKKYNGQNTCF